MQSIAVPFVSISPSRITTFWRKVKINSDLSINQDFLIDSIGKKEPEQLRLYEAPKMVFSDQPIPNIGGIEYEIEEIKKIKRPPKFKEHTGLISKKAKKRINNAIDWLLLLAKDKEVFDTKKKKRFKFKVSFVTLTLASKQIHSDNEIKKQLLNQFLVEARKRWKVDKYVWRAEKQKNGNIHFHIVVDKFIDWKSLVITWNRIQNKLGYVDRYAENQKEFFKNGFKFRKELSKNWSYAKQKRAYNLGRAFKFKNPNSTDIHSVRGVKNLSAYLSKYCTKNPDFRFQQHSERKCYLLELSCNYSHLELMQPVKVYDELLVEGKSWGLSQSLSKMKNLILERDSFVDAELEQLENLFYKQMYVGKYYCTLKIHFKQWETILLGHLKEIFINYLEVARSAFEAENLRICFDL